MTAARLLWKVDLVGNSGDNFAQTGEPANESGDANCVSSELPDGRHMPAIDLDVPHTYVPSTTPGHGHLLIDVPMSKDAYLGLLAHMAELGIVERGFAKASSLRGRSYLRLPHVKKDGSS